MKAWVFLGTINSKLDRYGDAENALKRAEQLSPGDTHCKLLLAKVYYDQGRCQNALPYMEQLIAGGSNEIPLLYAAARCAVATAQPEKACVWLQQLLRYVPNDEPTLHLRDSLSCQ